MGPRGRVKIADGNTNNLGRADEINIYDASNALVDRLTYDDQNLGGPRTQGTSGVPTSCQTLGANTVGVWVFSHEGVDGAKKSLSGDIGSPGTSPLGACGPVTIVGGNGSGSTVPCQPEAPSGTGPSPAGGRLAGQRRRHRRRQAVRVDDHDRPGGTRRQRPRVRPEQRERALHREEQELGLPPGEAGRPLGTGHRERLGRRQADLLPRQHDPDQPDSEGLTVGPDGALYVTTERNNAHNTIPLNSILRFDPTTSATQLVPTDQWNLTAEFPELHAGNKDKANLGFEGVTFVPDSYLSGNGFVDQSTGKTYKPIDYPQHGSGLYFAALENDGKLYAYALNADHSSTASPWSTPAWATSWTCSSTSTPSGSGRCATTPAGSPRPCSRSSSTGSIVPDVLYSKPASRLPNVNIEGFALAPDSTCVDGTKEVVWSDDGIYGAGHEGHALYSGTFPCGLDLDLDQTIDFPALPDTAPIGTVSLHATASSGLPVSYSSTTPTICTVSGSVVTPTAAGTCTIQATQSGNADYNPAAPVSRSFTVECQTLCLRNPNGSGEPASRRQRPGERRRG